MSADFNLDNRVDGQDFLIWQTGFGGQTGATLADGDGVVDGKNFHVWQANFGTGVSDAQVGQPAAARDRCKSSGRSLAASSSNPRSQD